MEKYCTKCGSVFKDETVKFCSSCGYELSERPGRQYIPKGLRHAVFQRDNYTCQECFRGKEDGVSLEIDHILPVAKGGTNHIDNLQTLCKDCNRNKHTNEWIAGETDLEVLENHYSRLLDKKFEFQEKLEFATNEDEIIDYKYNIKRINETLPDVKDKLRILRAKRLKFLREKEEKEIKNKLFKKLYVNLTDFQLDLFYNKFHSVVSSREDIIPYLVDNFSEDQINQLFIDLEIKYNILKRIQENLTDNQLELLYSNFRNVVYSKSKIIDYLVDHYSENEIYRLVDKLQTEKIKKEELYNTLTDNQLKLLSNKYDNISDYSRRRIIDDLFESYSLPEIDKKINKVKKEALEKEKLFIKLSVELDDDELKLFRNNFSNYNNYSKTNLIQELCNKHTEKEIYQILTRLKKKEKEEKDQYLKKVNENITDLNFNVLCNRFHYTGPKEDFADYIINNFSQNKFYQVLNESHKKILAIKLSNDDESLELLSRSVYRGGRSKEEYINYICDNYSEYEIYQKISQNRIEKQEKEKVLKDLSNLTDNQLEALYKRYPKFNNSKEKLINYLYKAYSVKQIYSLLDEIQEQLDKKMDENLLKQSLTPERMELIGLLDSSYNDENCQQMIDMLVWNYDENQIIGILNELDDITNELNEIEKQKDLEGFCILGFIDVWYYYYDSNGEFKRFYAFSYDELKRKALSKDLPVYKNFKNNISSSSAFSNKIRSKINVTVVTPHEKYYNMFSKDFKSENLKKEVILHLGSFSPEKTSDNIFKIIVPKSSLNDKTIICPNCGARIPKKAVRCKHCKNMMKDLLMMIDSELELYGLNPEELELV